MNKLRVVIVLWVVGTAGIAIAQPEGSAAPPAADPRRAACVEAMNADATFAKSIIDVARVKEGTETLDIHQAAHRHVQKNERHVLWAYAAMWIIAAMFLLYLWNRQMTLKTEIAQLRRDLDAASK